MAGINIIYLINFFIIYTKHYMNLIRLDKRGAPEAVALELITRLSTPGFIFNIGLISSY